MKLDNMVKAILIVLVSLLFLTEYFWFGGGYKSGGTTTTPVGQNITGTAVFNGTIRTYDPLLLLPSNTSQQIIDSLRLHPGVLDVKTEESRITVQTETRDDVFPIGSWLRSQNATAYAIANVAVTHDIEVDTATGKINASVSGNIIRVVTEPLLDVDSPVSVKMVAIVNSGMLVDYGSAQLLLNEVNVLLDATVESQNSNVYTYSIPWEKRDSLGNLSIYSLAEFNRVDSVIFKTPLTVSQILEKKMFPYVVYIDSSSATVDQNFDNLTALETNFADTPFSLPNSTLAITANSTPSIPFEPSVRYSYLVRIQNTSYDFGDSALSVEADKEYALNSTVELNVSALALGDKIISLRRVSLPS